MVPSAASLLVGSRLGRHLLARLGGQFGHVEVGLAEPAGQVRLDRRAGRGHLGLHIAQVQQHRGHLVGGVGGDTSLLDGADDGVVVAHQPGAAGPADQRVRQADPGRPRGLGVPAAHHGVQRRLGFTVSAVTAEHSAVGRARQHHVQPRRDIALGADLRQTADQPLHGPQQYLHLHLGARTGLRQVADDTRCREREQQRRGLRVLDVNRLWPKAFALLVADPFDQCVDVGVGRHVGRDHPQRRAVPSVVAIQRAVERQSLLVELGRRRDDGGTAVEQPRDHRRGDRTLGSACHDGDFAAVGTGIRVLGAGSDPAVQRRVDLTARGQRLALPPGGLSGDDVAGALEPLGQPHPVGVDVALVGQPQLDQVLAGAGPAVVEDDGLLGVEHRRHQTWPVRTQFGGDQVDELGIGGRRQRADRVVQAQLAQHQAGRRGEHAVATGDLIGEFGQRGGVDGRAAATARGRQRHRNAAARGDRSDRGVNDLVDGRRHRPARPRAGGPWRPHERWCPRGFPARPRP